MEKKTFTYISNIRLPTEKAHSIQIMKMCEAFADKGLEVELIIPDRKDNIGESNIFEYYCIKNTFKIRRVKSTDFLGKTLRFGQLFYWIDLLFFLTSLFLSVNIKEGSLLYSRDPILLVPFLRKKCILVAEIHDIPARQPFFWQLLRRVDGIIVITSYLKSKLVQKGLKVERIIVAPDAVDHRDFDIQVSQQEAKEKLDLPLDKKIVMYIGLFDEWKGYKTLLETSLLLSSEVQIVMIGGAPEQVNHLRVEYPLVIFLGFRPYREVVQNQRAADILVIPNSERAVISKFFTSPLKLFAHMASGVPIIVSDLPSLREIVDESSAFFFTPDNTESLANTINYVLSNSGNARKRTEHALAEVRQYSWQNRAKKVLEFIHV